MLLNKNKRFSLKTKLSLLFSTLFFFLISMVAIVSFLTLIHLFHKAQYDLLSSEMVEVKHIIQQNNSAILQHEIYDTPGIPISEAFQYYIRVTKVKNNGNARIFYYETQHP